MIGIRVETQLIFAGNEGPRIVLNDVYFDLNLTYQSVIRLVA